MKLTYRPALDGLRAIAILVVVLYHSKIIINGVQPFKGGFIGVDIFFVISGYLISSLILNEFKLTGNFSFSYFYERRIRRILPALLLAIIVFLPIAWIYLLPTSLIDFSKSILSTLGFSSNFYFHFSGQNYGAENTTLIPFLHTWSLSVEEQFYILFPLIIFFIFKFSKKNLFNILLISCLFSLILAEWGSRNHPAFNFYVLVTRSWEILFGSMLAYLEQNRIIKFFKNKIIHESISIVALLLIFLPVFLFDNDTRHPSFLTLFPVIGAGLLILFSNKENFVNHILSSSPFIFFGLISYSLYLFHFPIFSFARIIGIFEISLIYKVLFIILSIILSFFSYKYIEQPFRNNKFKFKKILIFICTFIFLITVFCAYVILNNGLENRVSKKLLSKINTYDVLKKDKDFWENCQIKNIIDQNFCQIGKFKKKVYLIGDSHVIPLAKDLGERLNNINLSLVVMFDPGNFFMKYGFDDIRHNFLLDIKNSHFIFGGYFQRESKSDILKLVNNYNVAFNQFKSKSNKIALIYPIPEMESKKNRFIHSSMREGKLIDDFVLRSSVEKRLKFPNSSLDRLSNIFRIYPSDFICDNTNCYSVKDNEFLKSDFDHPSLFLSQEINKYIVKNFIKF
jgi:peptidoglycan/LPS O-acetylase OafA/YrhL